MHESKENHAVATPKDDDELPLIESILFAGRWLLTPFNIGLLIGLLLYAFKFAQELVHIVVEIADVDETELLLKLLNQVDMAMVANLLVMVMIGNHSIFVRRMRIKNEKIRPQWSDHISSSLLKVKMSMSLVGISSIYLLQSFFAADKLGSETLWKQAGIHLVFVISTLALAWVDRLTHPNGHHFDHSTSGDQ